MNMKPVTPSKMVWSVGLVCGILGILGHFARIELLFNYSYWLLLAGFVILAIGTSFRKFRY